LFSCKTGNILIRKERKKEELKNISDAKLIRTTVENNIEYNTLFFKKFQAEITIDDQNKSFKGNLFIIKDSVIIVSITPLMGIELFRIKFVKDSIFILDRTKKTIDIVDYNFLWNKFFVDIDFSTIKNILLNQFYCYPSSTLEDNCIKKYKHYLRNDFYILQSIKSGRYSRFSKRNNFKEFIYHEFDIAPDIFKITKSYIQDFDNNMSLSINYDEFIILNSYVYPSVISINGNRKGSVFKINIKFNDIDINGVSRLSFKYNTDKYKIFNKIK
jgi:hypothetical protein